MIVISVLVQDYKQTLLLRRDFLDITEDKGR